MHKLRAGLLAVASTVVLASTVQAKTLIFCSEGSPEGFDPALFTAGTTFDASSRPIYNRLVEFENGTTNIVPGLAESWTVSDDGLQYTFKLRKDVAFQTTDYFKPTRPLNADDVVFSFDRQGNKDNPLHKAGGGTWEYYGSMSMPDLIKSVEKVDASTVKFVLSRPEAPMIANLAMDFASILSKEYADAQLAAGTPDNLNQKPVGTGPFKFVGYQKDAVVRYKAHPEYWGGKAKLDDLVFAITPDASVRYQKLKAGECHVMPYPNPADIAAMKTDPAITLMEQEGLNIGYLAYNTQQKPFDNPKVRKALNTAMNKQAIMDAVFQGSGKIAINPIPPTIWSYNTSVKDDPYDPAAAKKMLEAEGIKDLKMKVWAMPVQRPYNPNARRMAEMIQADWAKVGVTAKIVSYEWGEYLKRASAGEHQTALLGWTGDNGDPDNFLSVLLGCDAVKGGSNYARWCHKPYEDLIQKAKITADQTERAKLYQQAQAIFKEQAPWVTIGHSVVYQPVRKEVVDFRISPFGLNIFYGVDVKAK